MSDKFQLEIPLPSSRRSIKIEATGAPAHTLARWLVPGLLCGGLLLGLGVLALYIR